MSTFTPAQREAGLQSSGERVGEHLLRYVNAAVSNEMRKPLFVPGVGSIHIEPLRIDNDTGYAADSSMQSLHSLESRLAEEFNKNRVVHLHSLDDMTGGPYGSNFNKTVEIRTREALGRVLAAWSVKRTNIETKCFLYFKELQVSVDKIIGATPVMNAEGEVLTGVVALTERERILRDVNAKVLDYEAFNAVSIPTGLSDNVGEACQQACEWLITIAKRKSNWVVNGIIEPYLPPEIASTDQVAALKAIETERQKGARAIQRATRVPVIRAAYNVAKTAIENVVVANAPLWKLDTGSDILLTDGRHVVAYTAAGGNLTFRADNRVVDAEDAVGMGDVSIDRVTVPEPLSMTYQPASGTIATSHGVRVTYGGGTKHPPVGNYDVELTARNERGPSLLKIGFVVPDLQPAFPKPALADKAFRVVGPPTSTAVGLISFDDATGGNGELTYSISPTNIQGFRFDAVTRDLYVRRQGTLPAQTFTLTATDEDGDTATQTVLVSVLVTQE